MPETVKKIASLILKYWRQELEEDELNELLDWANQSPANREVFARLTNPDFIVDRLRELTVIRQEMRQRIWVEMQLSGTDMQETGEIRDDQKRRFPLLLIAWWKWLAAAILLVVAGLLYCRLILPSSGATVGGTGAGITEGELQSKSGAARSQVRFADGRILFPASMTHGTVLEHGPLKLIREPGGIRLHSIAANRVADSLLFTTITTPAGETLTVWLPDGTEVKLNEASLLRLPLVFSNSGRTVEASGELYFYVSQLNAGGSPVPFFVNTPGMNIEAHAARFNVHVYPKDKLAAATLEAGRMRVWKQVLPADAITDSGHRVDVVLEPGQQAQASNGTAGTEMGGIRVEKADLREVLSWKNEQENK